MEPTFAVSNSSYLLGIGPDIQGKRTKTLATGIKVFQSNSKAESEKDIWGQISFFDQISERNRVITIKEPPQLDEREIVCLSDTGDIFHFVVVTKELWDAKVNQIVNTPEEIREILSDTAKVQEYLQAQNP